MSQKFTPLPCFFTEVLRPPDGGGGAGAAASFFSTGVTSWPYQEERKCSTRYCNLASKPVTSWFSGCQLKATNVHRQLANEIHHPRCSLMGFRVIRRRISVPPDFHLEMIQCEWLSLVVLWPYRRGSMTITRIPRIKGFRVTRKRAFPVTRKRFIGGFRVTMLCDLSSQAPSHDQTKQSWEHFDGFEAI